MSKDKPRKKKASVTITRKMAKNPGDNGLFCSGFTHVFDVECESGSTCQCGKTYFCSFPRCTRVDKHTHCVDCGVTDHIAGAEECQPSSQRRYIDEET